MHVWPGRFRGWVAARFPLRVPTLAAGVFLLGCLVAGGAGAALAGSAPRAAEADVIADPVAPVPEAPLARATPLAEVEAASVTAVTSSWTPPAPPPRRSAGSGGGGGGGGGGSAVLTHTNAARAANGLAALGWNGTLAARSCTWARHLAASDSGLSHSSNGGGFGWWGENVASGYPSASSVVAGWMNSSGHRANILRPQYSAMGSCSATAGSGTVYWVQQFGG